MGEACCSRYACFCKSETVLFCLICSLFPLIEDNRLQFLVQLVISDTAPVLKSSPLSDEISGVAEFTRRSSFLHAGDIGEMVQLHVMQDEDQVRRGLA